jgi:hypothetical protein
MKAIVFRVLASVLIVGMAAAGGGKEASSPSGMKPAVADEAMTPASAGQTKRPNACSLFDRAEIEAIAGQPLTMLHDIQAEDQTACELSDKDGNVLVMVTVHWKGGKELARTQAAALSMAKQMLNDDEVDIEELTGSGKVRGLADKAYYSNVMPSWILKGDVLVEVISPRFGGEQTKKIFLAVAKKALARLPS